MIREKTAKKREAAAANAAIRATKPAFEKLSHGLEYLQELFNKYRKDIKDWEETRDSQQETTARYLGAFYDKIDEFNTQMDKERQARTIEDEVANGRISSLEHTSLIRCQCGALLSSLQLVCHECGEIRKDFPYDLEKFERLFDLQSCCMEELIPLADTIRKSTDISEEYAYKAELEDEIFTMEQIAAVSKSYIDNHPNEEATVYKRINRNAKAFLSKCKSSTIEIALVGKVKSGKSSLINALLGGDMASVNANPETSVLVKYRSTEDKNFLKVSFYNEAQWKKLWEAVKKDSVFQQSFETARAEDLKQRFLGARSIYKEYTSVEELKKEILKWTSSDSPEHFFVRKLEVGYQGNSLPHDVVLVDTPGLNDPSKYRSDITKRYMKKPDWILACVENNDLSEKDPMELINTIAANSGNRTEKILIVATKADMLFQDDLIKKQNLFLKQISPLFGGPGIAVDHFVSVSAETYSLFKKYLSSNITDKEQKRLKKYLSDLDIDSLADIANNKDKILRYCGIELLFNRIDELVLQKRRKFLLAELKENYKNTLKNIRDQATNNFLETSDYLYCLISDSIDIQKETEEAKETIEILENNRAQFQKAISSLRKQLEDNYEDR